jgi:hypothetical protein
MRQLLRNVPQKGVFRPAVADEHVIAGPGEHQEVFSCHKRQILRNFCGEADRGGVSGGLVLRRTLL